MEKITLPISGLHCEACEFITEDTIKKSGSHIKKVKVNRHRNNATISYQGQAPNLDEINAKLRPLGYVLGEEEKKPSSLSSTLLIIAGLLMLAVVLAGSFFFDFASLLPGKGFSLASAALIGLVAGVSTCMALVGGLVLSVSSAWSAKHPEEDGVSRAVPQLFFNAGRLLGFFILGGLLGLLGTSISPSPLFSGLLNVLVGATIIAVGLSLISPRFKSLIALPKSLAKRIDRYKQGEFSAGRTMLLGALTFFLPCGFTQAMQLYAVQSGSFVDGALAMSLFALGTAPGLMGMGLLGSKTGGKKKTAAFQAIAVIIIVFGLINAVNGSRLVRASAGPKQGVAAIETGAEKEAIEIRMTQEGNGYSPRYFQVEAGRPVRWIITSKSQYSCASSLVVPSLGIRRQLKLGENVIEFTPKKVGKIPFSCSMGMYTGTIEVTEAKQAAALSSEKGPDACRLAQSPEDCL